MVEDVADGDAPGFGLLADREAEFVEADAPLEALDFVAELPPISDDACALIIRHETGGRAFYDKVIKARPIWPGGSSGVTIGFGYDIGFNTVADLRRDWTELGDTALERLESACGRHGDKALKALAASLNDIVVPWEIAEKVFRARTLPRFVRLTAAALPNVDRLSPDSFGALVSLTFNRGASYNIAHKPEKDPKDRYREMRAIKTAMAAGRHADIPDLIQAMIRIWRGTDIETEMTRRRRNEAALFTHGLGSGAQPFVPSFAAPEDDTMTVDDEALAPDGDEFVEAEALDFAPAVSTAAVKWAPDRDAPDYAHLVEAPPPGGMFDLDAASLQALADANGFTLPDGRILFGLRGCAIVEGGGEFVESARLRDIRPDHQVARCVLGVWDRAGGRIAVFPGSTVPNAAAVVSWRTKKDMGNLLPTGLYGYIVGVHNGKPGCFLLRKTMNEKRTVIVRRSSDDLSYSLDDMAHRCEPGDNIHPTFFQTTAAFSSVGCQVVVGSAKPNGSHSGPWARFRELAGQTGGSGQAGTPFSYMLLTGAEATLASTGSPQRLRFGSTGDRVKALQAKLGLAGPDGEFGPTTAAALHAFQRARSQGQSDGIFSPTLDEAMGWGIFT